MPAPGEGETDGRTWRCGNGPSVADSGRQRAFLFERGSSRANRAHNAKHVLYPPAVTAHSAPLLLLGFLFLFYSLVAAVANGTLAFFSLRLSPAASPR